MKKTDDRWMTHNQLEVLDAIAKAKRAGIYLFYTDLPLATIRSLFKRGLIDTRRKGRVVVTRKGKKRLGQPWPKKVASSAGNPPAVEAAGVATASTGDDSAA